MTTFSYNLGLDQNPDPSYLFGSGRIRQVTVIQIRSDPDPQLWILIIVRRANERERVVNFYQFFCLFTEWVVHLGTRVRVGRERWWWWWSQTKQELSAITVYNPKYFTPFCTPTSSHNSELYTLAEV